MDVAESVAGVLLAACETDEVDLADHCESIYSLHGRAIARALRAFADVEVRQLGALAVSPSGAPLRSPLGAGVRAASVVVRASDSTREFVHGRSREQLAAEIRARVAIATTA